MKYAVQTFFDITATGITGHFKPAKIPFRDAAGNTITDLESWTRSRNQQRNWETITQILGLRTQLFRLQYLSQTQPTVLGCLNLKLKLITSTATMQTRLVC